MYFCPPPLTFTNISTISRRCFGAVLLGIALCFTSCDDFDDSAIWEAITGLEGRIEALEQWQDETNNNIAALHELLTTNDMITSVTPVLMGSDTIGYTLSFLNSEPITIYHGKQGAQGEAGDTPLIGLTQDDAGDWFWTLNGELMKDAEGNPIRANGEDGKDGEDGADGEDGSDGRPGSMGPAGRPGADGEDAPTPQIMLGSSLPTGASIKTDNGFTITDAWYLSVDNGATWYRVSGKDGAAGAPGTPGAAGESIFDKVEVKDGYVTFTLSDGTTFKVPCGCTIDDDGSYTVYTAEGLQAWAEALQDNNSLNITLADNITLTEDWTPIPDYAGTFDGNNKTITGLTINQSTTDNVGLFTSIAESGTVKNLKLDDVDITANSNVGAIAGQNRGTIENCSVSGSVTGSSNNSCVGGIAGWHSGGTITDCHSSATVKGIAFIGGIAGQSNASITACYSTGSVTATINSYNYSYAGGVVGMNNNGAILTACYATGNVEGEGISVGGVVGDNEYCTVTACYHATGSVIGASGSVGGVAGRNFEVGPLGSSILNACYWNGTVTDDTGIGEDRSNVGETTKVEGDWTAAMNAMNAALSGTGWQYETSSDETFPLVIKAAN